MLYKSCKCKCVVSVSPMPVIAQQGALVLIVGGGGGGGGGGGSHFFRLHLSGIAGARQVTILHRPPAARCIAQEERRKLEEEAETLRDRESELEAVRIELDDKARLLAQISMAAHPASNTPR